MVNLFQHRKCFDSLWLEDYINSLWKNGVANDILYLVYLMNRRANIVIRTPFGNIRLFTTNSLVKQGTSLGPILNNYSLDEVCAHSDSYQYGTVEIKSQEFVDDIADADLIMGHLKHSLVIKLSHILQKEKAKTIHC